VELILNVDGYKKIFFLENLLRDYIKSYVEREDLSKDLHNRIKDLAFVSGEEKLEDFETLLKYAHIGELFDFIKSKKFKNKKGNSIEVVNIGVLIKHRNDIMHSRSITPAEMEIIEKLCNTLVKKLEDNTFLTRWNRFLANEINEFYLPKVYIEYPVGKNFDRLIGRNNELRILKREVTKPIPTSIVGPGGLGKTALVLQLIEDFLYSPQQPFDNIYFMSFKNNVFDNGSIRRFEKAISNHKDLINRLASFMEIDTKEREIEEIEESVWENIFSTKTLLILDNLETQIVKSNLSEFTDIAEKFTSNFLKPSRLIITSRHGIGDREAKLPLYQFDIEKTEDLIKSYISEEILLEKKINKEDWEWIQSYTSGNPGLIIAFCNTLKSTRKKLLDLRVEYDTKYTSESIMLHEQLEEFLIFCFENTIESMTLESQIFLSAICYICSEANLTEINEEFITYLRDELDLRKLGERNLISQIFTNVGFLQPIPSSDKFFVNELFIVYLDGNYSSDVFNVFKLRELEWYPELEELKNHINEIQFNEELSIGKVLSELYLSRYKNNGDKKYLINSFFCEPTLDRLVKIYKGSADIEVIKYFNLLEKVQQQLKDKRGKFTQEQIVLLVIKALLSINKKILDRKINTLKQRDLLKYYEQLEKNIPILKSGFVNINIKKEACRFLTILKKYEKAESFTDGEPKLIDQRFNLFVKQVGDLSGKNSKECLIYIDKCKYILKTYPSDIKSSLRAQFKLYSARYFKKENYPIEALKLLDNYEEHFINNDINLLIFSLESLLIRMECLLSTNGEMKNILVLKDRFEKYRNFPLYAEIFKPKKDNLEQHYIKLQKELIRFKKTILK
jgi:GTPase SAR1 family protein